MAGTDDDTTPPGWYRQKDDPGVLRWWDGEVWTEDRMPLPTAASKARPSDGAPIRIADAVPGPVQRPAPDPSRRISSGANSAGRAPGNKRPPPPLGDDRPRTATWPPVEPRPAPLEPRRAPLASRPPTRAGDEASHRVVERHGGTLSPAGRVLVRAVLIFAVLGVGFFGYTKIRDAQPGDAGTLSAKPAELAKEPRGARALKDVVLTINDLPSGWATQAFDPAADDICQGRIPRSVLVPFELQSASFTQGSGGPFITNVVMRFANAEMARDYIDLTAETVDSCRNYDDNGSTITLGPLSFPVFADQTFAAKATGTSPYGAVDGDIIYIRHGSRVASIQTISFGQAKVSNELVLLLTRLVDRRL